MVAPLDIDIVHFHKLIHNNICSWTTVIYISDNMQLVDSKRLYKLTKGLYKAVCDSSVKNCGDYLVIVIFLYHIISDIKQLVKYIDHILWYALSHSRTCILCRHRLANKYQTIDSKSAPLV